MTTQVKDFGQFLAMAAPATPPPLPPPTFNNVPTSSPSSSTSTSSSFYDQSTVDDDNNNNNNNNNNSREDEEQFNENTLATLSPIQLVALSNLKLNNDMFSNRSLSIHRRILVKNFLTLLYRLNPPMDWAEMKLQMQQMDYGEDDFGSGPFLGGDSNKDGSLLLGEDEQNGWMERTLHAAGLDDKDEMNPIQQVRKIECNQCFAQF